MRQLLRSLLCALLLVTPALAQRDVPTAEEANALVQSGRFEEAEAAWRKRTEVDRLDAKAHFMRAYCLHASRRLDEAHEAHIFAARFPEYTATALYNHACVHALRGEKEAAFVALREAVAAGFNDAQLLESDEELVSLREDGRFEAIQLELRGKSKGMLAKLPAARRFDFYLGDWTRRNGDRVERRLQVTSAFDGNGMIISSRDAETGKTTDTSILMFDEADAIWRQIWIGKDGMTVTLEGRFQGDAMVLRQVSQDGKAKKSARAVYSNVSENGFSYQWQSSIDGGRTWETMATRIFTREDA